ncbi:MAG TPA: 2-amino-4-hydroxy-6-hydroxymethyldihydropteridine diphosphokinase [Gammaproteobacteria bacterium]|nr:2-amino-4-hydroxy-6-hydroxymethyldihydropteridine diphosphokinase [Gammaproteobacteria bacterium]
MAAVTAYVGLGANLQAPASQVRRALDELAAVPKTRITARSPLYKSPPLGPQDQPDYVNAVAAVETTLAPLELLAALRAIETAHGRRRDGTRWGPRSLDLDLLIYGDVTMQTPELTLPHPGVPERAFVLYPLHDIAPALVIPGLGAVSELRARLGDARIERLEPQDA